MQSKRIPFPNVPQFSKRDVAYATQASELRPFYKYAPTIDAFAEVIKDKQQDDIDRDLLVEQLKAQYSQLEAREEVTQQIERLADTQTFTLVTAHQPSLFTGPLYFIIKIASTINLARHLNQHYPEQHFVPVFVTGGEDHDFEEINHTHLFGQTITWENDESGAVGAMSTKSLTTVMEQLKEILGDSEDAQQTYQDITQHYLNHDKYGLATVSLVHQLFARFGLVVIDMNRPAFKQRFAPIMREELLNSPSQPLVAAAQQSLEELGYGAQAHARDINLFYLREGLRARIEREGNSYKIVDTDYQFSQEELLVELEQHPERFSPNVVMRPLYQECILPNLAYIGGGGELAYWLERKEQFAHFGLNYPMLIRRNSLLWIDKTANKRLQKLGISIEDSFRDTDLLIREYVSDNTDNELSLEEEKNQLNALFESIAQKATEIDPTLKKSVLAEHARQEKAIANLEGRLHRVEKQKYDTAINQLRSIKDKLFPGNGLQERHDNFLNFYLRYGQSFFDTLVSELNPLEEGMVVLIDQ